MTTTDHEPVTVTLATLRAKVAFLEDQLADRTAQRDRLQASHALASETISRLCDEVAGLRPHAAVLIDRQAQWDDTEAATAYVENWLEGYKP